ALAELVVWGGGELAGRVERGRPGIGERDVILEQVDGDGREGLGRDGAVGEDALRRRRTTGAAVGFVRRDVVAQPLRQHLRPIGTAHYFGQVFDVENTIPHVH